MFYKDYDEYLDTKSNHEERWIDRQYEKNVPQYLKDEIEELLEKYNHKIMAMPNDDYKRYLRIREKINSYIDC